ncbi:unnamed protein product [Lota lota]
MSNGSTGAPRGCGPSIKPIYFNLCDLDTAWGVAVEAVGAAGVVTSLVLLVFLVGILPFVADGQRRRLVPLQAAFTAFTLGLFGLALAFIAGRDFTTCAARRFVFGVLFAGCLACLVTHGWWVTLLGRGRGEPRCSALYLGALALWLVEVIVNAEWLTITAGRPPPAPLGPDLSCGIANQDFVMALIYVMVLLLAAVLAAAASLAQKARRWRRDGAFILATGALTAALWAAWISVYVYGNQAAGNADWDDAAIAIALVSNAWVFLVLYAIPEACLLSQGEAGQEEEEQPDGDHGPYPARSSLDNGPDRSQVHRNICLDNAAMALDEPKTPVTPVTPDGPKPGLLRRGVYQPTEMALITKGLTYSDFHQNTGLPMASAPPLNTDTSLPSLAWPPPPAGLRHVDSGDGLNRKALW